MRLAIGREVLFVPTPVNSVAVHDRLWVAGHVFRVAVKKRECTAAAFVAQSALASGQHPDCRTVRSNYRSAIRSQRGASRFHYRYQRARYKDGVPLWIQSWIIGVGPSAPRKARI